MPIRFCWLWTDHFTAGDILNLFCYAYIFKKVIFVIPVQLIKILQQLNDKCFEGAIWMRTYVLKCIVWGRNLRTLMFWTVLFEGAILKNTYFFWGSNLSSEMYEQFIQNLWLLISLTAALYFHGCWIVWLLIYILIKVFTASKSFYNIDMYKYKFKMYKGLWITVN